MEKKKMPFVYSSLAHFYFILILPTSMLTVIVGSLFNEKSFTVDQLKSPGIWLGFLTFQLVFGTLIYFWDYKSRSKSFSESA